MDAERCPTCWQAVPRPQRGDHDYGIPLRATPAVMTTGQDYPTPTWETAAPAVTETDLRAHHAPPDVHCCYHGADPECVCGCHMNGCPCIAPPFYPSRPALATARRDALYIAALATPPVTEPFADIKPCHDPECAAHAPAVTETDLRDRIVELVWKARELDDPNAVVDDLFALAAPAVTETDLRAATVATLFERWGIDCDPDGNAAHTTCDHDEQAERFVREYAALATPPAEPEA